MYPRMHGEMSCAALLRELDLEAAVLVRKQLDPGVLCAFYPDDLMGNGDSALIQRRQRDPRPACLLSVPIAHEHIGASLYRVAGASTVLCLIALAVAPLSVYENRAAPFTCLPVLRAAACAVAAGIANPQCSSLVDKYVR